MNLYWETTPSHSYTLKQDGAAIEKGKLHSGQTVKLAATVPVLLKKKFSIHANGQANFYVFETQGGTGNPASILFPDDENSYNYYKGTIGGNYRTKVFNKPFIVNATLSGDGWSKGFEKVQGTLSMLWVLRHSATTNLSVGVHGMTLFNLTPVVPLITYSHQFNPNLSIDILLPSRTYLRYQFKNSHRFSIGASLSSEQFYVRPAVEGLPETCIYSKANVKPEIVYEYIINERFFFIAKGGGSQIIQGGLYKTNRKGVDGKPYIKFTQPMTPFVYFGFSYNLFK